MLAMEPRLEASVGLVIAPGSPSMMVSDTSAPSGLSPEAARLSVLVSETTVPDPIGLVGTTLVSVLVWQRSTGGGVGCPATVTASTPTCEHGEMATARRVTMAPESRIDQPVNPAWPSGFPPWPVTIC